MQMLLVYLSTASPSGKEANIQHEIEIPLEVRARYIERRKQDLESLRLAVETGVLEEFKRVGHQLKGNAASFGYLDLEKMAAQIEEAGDNHDIPLATKQLGLFEAWLNRQPKI